MESLKKINNLTLHSVTGKVDDSFIGIKIKNSLIDFYFPETYDIAEEYDIANLRNDIFAILRTISLAKTFTESNEKVENKFSINGQFALMSYLWIINDYLRISLLRMSGTIRATIAIMLTASSRA